MVHKFRHSAKAASGPRSLPCFGEIVRPKSFRTTGGLLAALGLFAALTGTSAYSADTPGSLAAAVRPNNLGVAYMNQQKGEDALAQFKLAIAADPSLAVPYMNAGIVDLVLQHLPESKAELDRAAKIDPSNPRIWYNLGLLERAQSKLRGQHRGL